MQREGAAQPAKGDIPVGWASSPAREAQLFFTWVKTGGEGEERESREAMERSFVTPAMKAANEKLREDEEHFIDWAASSGFFAEEHVIIE